MLTLPPALAPFGAYRQFIVCQLVPDPQNPGKTFKYPLDPITHKIKDAHDPSIWTTVDHACMLANAWGPGFCPGFVFTENDPFFFIDVDNCVDTSGQWTPIVHELSVALPGAAIEVSQSGRGLHFFGTGSAPADRRKKDTTNKLFDLYTEKRFVALTFDRITGDANTVHTGALHALTDKYLKRDSSGEMVGWTDGPAAGWNGPTDDEVLIRRALESRSAAAEFGSKQGASFADLWNCNVDALARRYPPDGNGTLPYDASAVDRALAQHLAFWTGKDCERIERLMRQSALRRDKWERADYLERTIDGAVAVQTVICVDKPKEPLVGIADSPATPEGELEAPRPTLVTGSTYMDINDQVNAFAGCVYVCDAHRVLVPGGLMLKPDQFRVMFGGYEFMTTSDGTAKMTSDAWDAFTMSFALRAPKADSVCYRPGLAPGVLVDFDGRKKANSYWPAEIRRMQGDVSLFMRHLELLLPVARDREILLSYMCACVQHKGSKFKWAPLIQGVEGNGKTILSQCVAYAVGRRHTHWPRSDQISEKFNSWLFDKVFIGVEDVFTSDRDVDLFEILKPMITGDNLAKRAMNTDQIDADCCANFMLNTNHKGGLRKTRNDRRIAPFFTAQQESADLVRDGMGYAYFERLVGWLKKDGFAIVAELLATRPISSEFNPAFGQIAPMTSSTEEAIAHGFGKIEQEVQEAIDQNEQGFMGGWISSAAFDRLLANMGKTGALARNMRRECLKNLGYDWHPGLVRGRVNNPIVTEGAGKPRLFIKKGHPAAYLTDPVAIATAYSEAQLVKNLQPLNNSSTV